MEVAQKIASALTEVSGDRLVVEPWFEAVPAAPSELLPRLVDWSRRCDFAVVLLSRDALQVDKRTTGRSEASEEVLFDSPRDNCVFELGLFIGAFGGSERCLVLSELEHEDLVKQLSDISGLIYERFSTEKLEADGEKELSRIVSWIRDRVAARGRFESRPWFSALKVEEVLSREADPNVVGHHDVVVVKEHNPAELKLAFAGTVMSNILERHVRYFYLFGRTAGKYEEKIVEMLRSLIVSSALDTDEERSDYDRAPNSTRIDLLSRLWSETDQRDRLKAAIASLKRDLLIGLVDDIDFDEFCVHRANIKRKRQGYLKITRRDGKRGLRERYLPLESIETTMRLNHPGYGAFDQDRKAWHEDWIFRGSKRTRITAKEEARIRAAIKLLFPPEYRRSLNQACFGGKSRRPSVPRLAARGAT